MILLETKLFKTKKQSKQKKTSTRKIGHHGGSLAGAMTFKDTLISVAIQQEQNVFFLAAGMM